MLIELFWPDSCSRKPPKEFLQRMLNRLVVGHYRYGPPKRSQLYLTRLTKELKAYKKSGNQEQLINIANYTILEMLAPEHKNNHYDPTVESVTRNVKRRTEGD